MILYIFYPAIVAYYEIIKDRIGIYTPTAFFIHINNVSLHIVCNSSWLTLSTQLKYLLYFLLGIYTNDNYELIYRSFERISMKEIMLLSGLILGLPFFSMFIVVDQRFSTQFSNSIPHYHQLTWVSTYLLHICIFTLCLYQLLVYKPSIGILQKIGEYSDEIFLVHAFFHNSFTVSIFPRLSIFPTSLNFYIILFTVMLTMIYFTVKLMLSNCFTTYRFTGKLKPDQHSTQHF